jgi:hypothetical protein
MPHGRWHLAGERRPTLRRWVASSRSLAWLRRSGWARRLTQFQAMCCPALLTVTKRDRLAHSTAELLAIEADLSKRGIGLAVLSMGGERLDTCNPTSKLMLTILAGEECTMTAKTRLPYAPEFRRQMVHWCAPAARRSSLRRCHFRRRRRPLMTKPPRHGPFRPPPRPSAQRTRR